MTVKYHEIEQGTDEWLSLRLGKLTASTVSNILTPTLKTAANDKSRAFLAKAASERITGQIEETFTTEKMLRGHIDEGVARDIYAEKYAPVAETGFVTNSAYPNFGYSPDGLVGTDGLIEVKSRDPHLQIKTILEYRETGAVPKEYMAQMQAGMLISERSWCDFISFSHGLPMLCARVFRDETYIAAIIDAANAFETTVSEMVAEFSGAVTDPAKFTPTERIDYEGMIL